MFRNTTSRINRRTALLSAVALGATTGLFSSPALAAQAPVNTLKNSVFGGRTDTAINGYDTVAYFAVGKPVKGLDNLATDWNGAKWKFSTQANLDLFKASPEKYAPQYGGYCAYGVTQGYLVKVEPEQFTVRDGKLYLNFDADVQAKWLKDPAGYIKSADAKFADLLKK
jgi:YHS domain-containing protein